MSLTVSSPLTEQVSPQAVSGNALQTKTPLQQSGYSWISRAKILQAIMLMQGERPLFQHVQAITAGMDNEWGGGRLRQRLFSSAGMPGV